MRSQWKMLRRAQQRLAASRVSNSEHWQAYVQDTKAAFGQHAVDRRRFAGFVVALAGGYLIATTVTSPGVHAPAPLAAAYEWLFPNTFELNAGEQFDERWGKRQEKYR